MREDVKKNDMKVINTGRLIFIFYLTIFLVIYKVSMYENKYGILGILRRE